MLDMHQIEEKELHFAIKFALQQTRVSTFKDAASGHQDTRTRAFETITEAIMARMTRWEILVPEPAENLFRDITAVERERFGFAPKPER